MPDPIWVDNNAASRAIKGDAAIQAELASFRKDGRQLLLVPAAYNEILNGNVVTGSGAPTAQSKADMEIALRRMGFELDMSAQKRPLSDRIRVSPNVSISDGAILSQVKASADARGVANPEIFTTEGPAKGMVAGAPHFGVRAVRPGQASKAPAAPPRVNLADYPEDSDGPLSKYFKDRPLWKKIGVIGGSVLASQLAGALIQMVEAHFREAVEKAGKEFARTHPEAHVLMRAARIDQHRAAYEAALAKINKPGNAKVVAGVLLALTPDKDIAAAKRHFDKQLSKVKLTDGTMGGFADAAEAYIGAMADLLTELAKYQKDLPDIAADLNRRAAVLAKIGNSLTKTFFKYAPLAAMNPISYYPWFDVYNVAQVFERLGATVGGLATEVSGRARSYDRLYDALHAELLKVSNRLNQLAP